MGLISWFLKLKWYIKLILIFVAILFFATLLIPSSKPVPSTPSAAPTKEKITYTEKQISDALSKLRLQKDAIQKIDFYYSKLNSDSLASNQILIYIGKQNKNPWLRFVIKYYGSDWLFANKFIVQADGVNYEFPIPLSDRDVMSGGMVSERFDITEDGLFTPMLKAIANSKKAVIRLEGKSFYKDREITKNEKQAILDVFSGYEVLGGNQ